MSRLLLPALLYATLAFAQNPPAVPGVASGVVSGIVIDPSDAVVSGAVVTLKSRGRTAVQTTTDAKGEFSFDAIADGPHELLAEYSGFKPEVVRVNLKNSGVRRVQIVLSIAGVSESVQVDAGESRASVNSQGNLDVLRLDANQLDDLPMLNGDPLAALLPLLDQGSLGAGGPTVVVDGMTNPGAHLTLSEIQEVRINNNPYSAEYARPGRGRIEVTTKKGAPQYHGMLGIGLRDYRLDARNFFARTKPEEDRRQLDGNLSGPLLKHDEKNTFYVAFSRSADDLQPPVYAVGLTGPIRLTADEKQTSQYFSTQVTRRVGKSTSSFRYTHFEWSDLGQGVGGFTLPEAGADGKSRDEQLYWSNQTTFGSHLVNEFFIRARSDRSSAASLLAGVPKIVVDGAFTNGGGQVDWASTENSAQFNDNVSWSHGRHLVKAGVSVPAFSRLGSDMRSNFGGTYYFSSLAAYTQGTAYSYVRRAGDGNVVFWQKQAAGFVQDEVKLRPNLSVAVGLRYEWQNYGAGSGNFAPRFSFAYALDKAAKTIVRGGAGLFYDVFPASDIRDTLLLNGARLQQFRVLNADYPSPAAGAAAARPPDVAQFSPTLRSPYLLQYSFAVERQVRKSLTWSTTFTNMRGIDLYRSRDANAPPPPLYAARPVSSIGALHLYESSGGLKSYGLQTALRGDLTRYFKGMVIYELGRASNDTDGIGAFPANNWNLNGEWARASFDVRHYIYLYGTVNAGKWLKFGLVFSANSGKPYTLTTGLDPYHTGLANARPEGVARNTLRGTPTSTLDLHWSREFPVHVSDVKGMRLAVGADLFNLFNRTNYTSFVGSLRSPFFGAPVSAGPARRTQLSLSVRF